MPKYVVNLWYEIISTEKFYQLAHLVMLDVKFFLKKKKVKQFNLRVQNDHSVWADSVADISVKSRC